MYLAFTPLMFFFAFYPVKPPWGEKKFLQETKGWNDQQAKDFAKHRRNLQNAYRGKTTLKTSTIEQFSSILGEPVGELMKRILMRKRSHATPSSFEEDYQIFLEAWCPELAHPGFEQVKEYVKAIDVSIDDYLESSNRNDKSSLFSKIQLPDRIKEFLITHTTSQAITSSKHHSFLLWLLELFVFYLAICEVPRKRNHPGCYSTLFEKIEPSYIKRIQKGITKALHQKGKTVIWLYEQMHYDEKRWKRHLKSEQFIQPQFLLDFCKIYYPVVNPKEWELMKKENPEQEKEHIEYYHTVFCSIVRHAYILDRLNVDNPEVERCKGEKTSLPLKKTDLEIALSHFEEYVSFADNRIRSNNLEP